MEPLTVEDLLSIAEEVLGVPAVTDIGLLDVAVAAGHMELGKLSERLASWTHQVHS